MGIFIILVVVILLSSAFIRRRRMKLLEKQKNSMGEYLSRLRHFMTFKQYIGMDGCSGIAIDKNREEICLVNNRNGIVKGKIIIYKDIISSEIIEDDQAIALHIVTKDMEQPNHIVNFVNIQTKIDSSLYKVAIEEVRYWDRLMSTIIHQVEEDEKFPKRSISEIPAI